MAAFLTFYEWWAHRDGVIDDSERCILSLSVGTEYLLAIVELADIIWVTCCQLFISYHIVLF